MPPVQIDGEFYNVAEKYTLYDTIAIVGNLTSLAKQPPGWFSTFAAFGAGVNHSFFNVRNRGNCEPAYCNMDARDQLSFAFQLQSIGCAFWGSTWATPNDQGEITQRAPIQGALWRCEIPINSSLTLRVQQDEKLKCGALMANAGYGPTGGGYANYMNDDPSIALPYAPNYMAQTQGVPEPKACLPLPNEINMPRRASIEVKLSLTEYARQLLQWLNGPGEALIYNQSLALVGRDIMMGITVTLNGRRLVQQRGALHA
jgi:hypothetical protein